MKTILLGTALAALLVAPAAAQFKKPAPFHVNDFTALECAIVHATDRDRKDPVYKIDVHLTLDRGDLRELWVVHTSTSGATHVRSDQYTDSTIWQKPHYLEWYWHGRHGHNTMTGEVWHNDQGWWYSEKLFTGDRFLEYQMVSHCHEPDDGAKDDGFRSNAKENDLRSMKQFDQWR
jgi:hypothetical protein